MFGGIHDIAHERNDLFGYKEELEQWRCLEKDDLQRYEELELLTPIMKNSNLNQLNASKSGLFPAEETRDRYSSVDQDQDLDSADRLINRKQKHPFLAIAPKNAAFLRRPYRKGAESSIQDSSTWKTDTEASKKERLKKERLIRKMNLLAELDVPFDQKDQYDVASPTTQALKTSIASLPNLIKKGTGVKKSDTIFVKTEESTAGDEKNHISSSSTLKGKKPCARDGFSACVHGGRLIVFGGDRHHMPFNDIFALNLEKLVTKL